MEIWLRPNLRYLTLQLVLVAAAWLVAVTGTTCAWLSSWHPIAVGGLVIVMLGFGTWVFRVARQLLTPRIGYRDASLAVNLGAGPTFTIPIDEVECFFLGQGAPGMRAAEQAGAEASTIVVRLSERSEGWRRRDVPAHLGHWCDGYITIRGTWCEPIDLQRVNQLNHRLAAIKRQRRAEART